MIMKYKVVILISLFVGVVLSFFSGFLVSVITPAGIIFHGFPFYWLTQGSIGPGTNLNQYNIIWINLIFNIVLYFVIVFLLLWIYNKFKKKK
jgi:phosphotransferase system  glucose/maltose/N-acetylglucosamine-specific IIC component